MTKTELTKHEKAILLFFLKGFLSDFSKALIFFIPFYLLGLHKEFLWGIFFLVLFRIFSGGLHCRTYWGCLILSFVIFSSGILAGITFFFNPVSKNIITIICGIIVFWCSPVVSKTRPKPTKKGIRTSKIYSTLVVAFFFILNLSLEDKTYINIGFWFLILHTLQLFVAYVRR